MKLNLIILFCVVSITGIYAQKNYSLKECVEIAVKNNGAIKTTLVDVVQAELNFKQLDLSKYPNVNAGFNSGLNFGRNINPTTNQFENNTVYYNTIGIQTSVDIFNWFSKRYNIEGAKLDVEASKLAVTKASDDVVLNVAIAYIQILLAKEQLKQIILQIAQRKNQIDITEKRVKAGVLPELNLLEFQSNLALDSAQYYNAEASITSALLRMQQILNVPATEPFDVTSIDVNSIPIDNIDTLLPSNIYQLALKNLPQQRLNDVRFKAQEKKLEATRKAYYPTISVVGNLGSNYANNKYSIPQYTLSNVYTQTPLKVNIGGSDYFIQQPEQLIDGYRIIKAPAYFTQLNNNFRQSIGLNISIPIFNGGITKLNILRSKLGLNRIQLAKEQDNLKLEQDVFKAYNDALNAKKQYNAFIHATTLAEKTFYFASKRYDLGLINNFDLSTAQNNLFIAQLKQLYAQYDYVFKIKLLEYYKGEGIKLEK